MELNIKNTSSRILLERAENGIILYEIGENNSVLTRLVYETHFQDGLLNFEAIAQFMMEALEILKIPGHENETNRKLVIYVQKISDVENEYDDDDDDGNDD